jgi:hypothetical protein
MPAHNRPAIVQRPLPPERTSSTATGCLELARCAAKHSALCSRLPPLTSNIRIAPLARHATALSQDIHCMCHVNCRNAGRHLMSPGPPGMAISTRRLMIRFAEGALDLMQTINHANL